MKHKTMALLLLWLIAISLTVLSASAFQDFTEPSNEVLGDPDYKVNLDEMSFWQKIRMGFLRGQPFTVVDGATCSLYPDWGADYTPPDSSTLELCHNNDNHIGVVFQLFEVTSSGWTYIGDRQILENQRGCFDVDYGKNYHYDIYFCDERVTRECIDSDGGINVDTKGTVTFTLGGDSTVVEDRCESSARILERYCDSDDSVVTEARFCDCLNGACQIEQSDELEIEIDSVSVSNNGDLTLNQKYDITGRAYINGKCEGCVIESGQGYYGSTLSLLSSDKGACGDDISVGVKFNAEDEWVDFTFEDIATQEGSFSLEVAAYNGCYEEKGSDFKLLDSKKVTINVFEAPEPTTEPKSNPVTCYFCKGIEMIAASYDSVCPEGTQSEKIECTSEKTECSNVAGGSSCEVTPPDKSSSSPVTSSVNPPSISSGASKFEEFKDDYFNYQENPVVAWLMTGIVVMIVVLIILIINNARR